MSDLEENQEIEIQKLKKLNRWLIASLAIIVVGIVICASTLVIFTVQVQMTDETTKRALVVGYLSPFEDLDTFEDAQGKYELHIDYDPEAKEFTITFQSFLKDLEAEPFKLTTYTIDYSQYNCVVEYENHCYEQLVLEFNDFNTSKTYELELLRVKYYNA